jgi:hypothetical protein
MGHNDNVFINGPFILYGKKTPRDLISPIGKL